MRYRAYILDKDLNTTGEVIESDDLKSVYRAARYQVRIETDWTGGAFLYDSKRELGRRIFAAMLNINGYNFHRF